MPHVSPSSSEELTYNAMLQIKVDYFCHSWCQEEATRTQRLLWYRGDLLARYGYGPEVRTRCENLLWRLQYMLLPERVIKEQPGVNKVVTRATRRTVSHVWRNRFEKYNTPLIGPVYLAGRRWRPAHQTRTVSCSGVLPMKPPINKTLANSVSATLHDTRINREINSTSVAHSPSVPRVMSDGALSSCIRSVNVHTPISVIRPFNHQTIQVSSSSSSSSVVSGPVRTLFKSSDSNSSTMLSSINPLSIEMPFVDHSYVTNMTATSYPISVASDNNLAAHLTPPIKSALKRSYGSFVNINMPVYQPQLCRLDHLDLAGQLTPNRLRNLNESPWDAISPPINGSLPTTSSPSACDDYASHSICTNINHQLGYSGMSMKSIPAMLSHHGQASVASSDSLCSNKSDDSSTYHCKRQEVSAPSTPPKPRLTFKDTVERRVYVSDCEYSMHLEPLDNALYIRRRKSLRRRTGANGKFITDYDGTTDSDLLMAEETATSNCHPQNDTIDTASTTLIDTQNDELVVSLSADTLSHLLPQDHLNNNDDDDDDDDDLSSLTIGGCSGWDFEDEEDEEDEQELEDSDEDLYEESDEDFDNDDIWQDDDLESSSISASSNKQALHGRVNDQQHRNNSSHRHRHRQQQQHQHRRRRRRRNEPSAGQRAAAMAGNIIELINEACDLIHWIASVWLIGYYI